MALLNWHIYQVDATYYYLKPQFYNDFKRMDFNMAADQGMGAIFMLGPMEDFLQKFPDDIKKLFSELGCDHPVLNQLETNLILASKGKSPIQKLMKYVF